MNAKGKKFNTKVILHIHHPILHFSIDSHMKFKNRILFLTLRAAVIVTDLQVFCSAVLWMKGRMKA